MFSVRCRFTSSTAILAAGLSAIFCSNARAAIPQTERSALLALYNSTHGDQWTNHSGWNDAAGTECSWFGVQCDEGQTTVATLLLPDNGLSGTLPSLNGLPHLQALYVQDNAIGGGAPALGALVELHEVYLNGNKFSGPLPTMSGLTALINFDVSGNQFTGALPSLNGLSSLVYFNAEDNLLSGTIPLLNGAPALQIYAVDSNDLTGAVPALSGLSALQSFSAGYNRLTGSLPMMTGLPQLGYFNVAANQLTGSIPALSALTALQGFDVSDNQLSGPIPSLAGLAQLQQLWLSGNRLSGTIPGNLPNLSALGVDRNQLTGTLPALGGMTNLQYLYAGNNQLSGSIPTLGALTKLLTFDVDGNQLSGAMPAISASIHLNYFSVARNHLSGALPALTSLKDLSVFDASFNQFSGPIPALNGSPKLTYVYLGFNALSGSIPPLSGLDQLLEFVVDDNQLTGPVPALGGLASLQSFIADANQLSGPLPALNGLTHLAYFGASGNKLEGPLPALSGLNNLTYFDVSSNRITGSIPALNQLPSLQVLYLDINQLSGSLPSLSGLGNLQIFDANSNQLSGSLPALSGLFLLQEFNVYSNQLTGSVPALGDLQRLQIFDIGNNRLSGAIPNVPQPNSLVGGLSTLCPNLFAHTPNSDWDAATALEPWFATCTQSESTNGAPTSKDSTQIVLSYDGSVKVFQSQQTDLTSNKANAGGQDIYSVKANGAPVLESIDANGNKLLGITSAPAVSQDGKIVAFLYSQATPAATPTTVGTSWQLYAGAQGAPKHRVDAGTGGAVPNGPIVGAPSLSSAGGMNHIVFCSAASNLVNGDVNGQRDVFLADPIGMAAPIQLASVGSGGQQIAGDSCEPRLSGDGTKLVFSTSAPSLFATPTRQIVVKDLGPGRSSLTGAPQLITPALGTSSGANADSSEPAINDDGSVIAFTSAATNLDGMGAPVGGGEVFVSLTPMPGTRLIERARASDTAPNGGSQHPLLSGDGTVLVMQTQATNLLKAPTVAQDNAPPAQCGAVALTTNYFSLSGMGAPLCGGTTQNQNPSISGDGTIVGFDSNTQQEMGGDNRNAYAQGVGAYTGITGMAVPNLSGDYSGQWFDPNQSGQGLVIDVTAPDANNQRFLVMTWFVYLNGQPTWVQGVGVPHAGTGAAANTVAVDMQVGIFRGVSFPLGEARATGNLWGTATLTFTDASTGTLTWRSAYPGFNSGTMSIKHFLAVGQPAQDVAGAKVKACYSGAWFNPAQSGHGFEFEILPGANPLLVVDWFTYSPQGAPVWLAGVGAITGNTAQVPLQIRDGVGAQFPPNYDSSSVAIHDWGAATFTFTDSTHAVFSWNSPLAGYGSGTQPLQPIFRMDRRTCD